MLYILITRKSKSPYLAIVDFTKPSDEKRLWIFNMTDDRLVLPPQNP
ncbi:MAG: hypothetical protein GY821_06725 [Gammaproteobacteria bacterium]|nr:hypothetical protein [Gammaproteobacteria bacterium]